MNRLIVSVLALVALAVGTSVHADVEPIEERGKNYSTFSTEKDAELSQQTYSEEEVREAAEAFFDGASEGIGKALERAFSDYGRPSAYILGEEGGGAFVVGLRYGQGTLQYKAGGAMPVWWQGP